MAKHKHYDVIVAWAEGRPIQRRHSPTNQWTDYDDKDIAPMFRTHWEYRIKPTTVRYRVGLFRYGEAIIPSAVYSSNQEEQWEKGSAFVGWITDWTEVDVL